MFITDREFFSKPPEGSDDRIDAEQGLDRQRKEHGQEATKPHAISPSTTTHRHPPQGFSPYMEPKLIIPFLRELAGNIEAVVWPPSGLPARISSRRSRFGCPGCDRLGGAPDRQAAALTQAGVISGPVRDLALP